MNTLSLDDTHTKKHLATGCSKAFHHCFDSRPTDVMSLHPSFLLLLTFILRLLYCCLRHYLIFLSFPLLTYSFAVLLFLTLVFNFAILNPFSQSAASDLISCNYSFFSKLSSHFSCLFYAFIFSALHISHNCLFFVCHLTNVQPLLHCSLSFYCVLWLFWE